LIEQNRHIIPMCAQHQDKILWQQPEWNVSEGVFICTQPLGVVHLVSAICTCYMMPQAEVQSQRRMYRLKLVILEILCDECAINGG
jgi:hypothetical protein